MTATSDHRGLVLPEQLATARIGTGVDHGRRWLSWVLDAQGQWHRCGYERAELEVIEAEAWRALLTRIRWPERRP